MILLRPDCLLVKTEEGVAVPCSAEAVTVELVGEAAAGLEPELMQNAAAAVLHYFKIELQRETVTVAEFAEALAKVLEKLGLSVIVEEATSSRPSWVDADLRLLAAECGAGFELAFFQRLRDEVRLRLDGSPDAIRFRGLRSCVKDLSGSRRWSPRCQALNDQIVDFLRRCWSTEPRTKDTALIVQ